MEVSSKVRAIIYIIEQAKRELANSDFMRISNYKFLVLTTMSCKVEPHSTFPYLSIFPINWLACSKQSDSSKQKSQSIT